MLILGILLAFCVLLWLSKAPWSGDIVDLYVPSYDRKPWPYWTDRENPTSPERVDELL